MNEIIEPSVMSIHYVNEVNRFLLKKKKRDSFDETFIKEC